MTQRLSDRVVKGIKTPTGKYRIYYDDQVIGFGIRITRSGAKSFVLNYAANGRERRYTIGRYPAWSVAAARAEASRLRQTVDLGGDPMAERKAKNAEPTVNGLCDRFLEHAQVKNRASTFAHYERLIEKYVRPSLGKLKVSAVKHTDIEKIHETASKTGPYIGNRLVGLLSRIFNLAIKWELRGDNPVKGIERNQEHKRERYLSGPELSQVCKALAEYPYKQKIRLGRAEALEAGQKWAWRDRETPLAERQQSCNALRLMMLTGARKSEVLSAKWDQIDFDTGTWTKPGATTKQKTEHRVPLSAPALQLLSGIEKTSEYIFPNRDGGPQADVKKTWASIRELADIPDVRIHDLRHTYAAQLASAGLSLPIIGALLGHTQAATTARYAHLMDDPLREATETVGAAFQAANDESARNPVGQGKSHGG